MIAILTRCGYRTINVKTAVAITNCGHQCMPIKVKNVPKPNQYIPFIVHVWYCRLSSLYSQKLTNAQCSSLCKIYMSANSNASQSTGTIYIYINENHKHSHEKYFACNYTKGFGIHAPHNVLPLLNRFHA